MFNRPTEMMRKSDPRVHLDSRDDRGAGMVEYALLVLLVAIALIGALVALRTGVADSLTDSASVFP